MHSHTKRIKLEQYYPFSNTEEMYEKIKIPSTFSPTERKKCSKYDFLNFKIM